MVVTSSARGGGGDRALSRGRDFGLAPAGIHNQRPGRNYAAQLAIVKQMTGRNRAAQLAIVKQMSRH